MSEKGLWSIHANAHEHYGYWRTRITAMKVDPYGMDQLVINLHDSVKIPVFDGEIDQLWVVLCSLTHLVEANGAEGRICGVHEPRLF